MRQLLAPKASPFSGRQVYPKTAAPKNGAETASEKRIKIDAAFSTRGERLPLKNLGDASAAACMRAASTGISSRRLLLLDLSRRPLRGARHLDILLLASGGAAATVVSECPMA